MEAVVWDVVVAAVVEEVDVEVRTGTQNVNSRNPRMRREGMRWGNFILTVNEFFSQPR